jgi:ribosomal protein S18 acetylase RimI-like enzyme
MTLDLEPASPADVLVIRDLAERIWYACYPGMISVGQIRYMIEWMYAPHKLASEIERGVHYWIARSGHHPAGYFAWELFPGAPDHPVAHLHKLYLLPEWHGAGHGQHLLAQFLTKAAAAGAHSAELRVNRANPRALKAYRRAGFELAGSAVTDIGAGYVMDDFILRRALIRPPVPLSTQSGTTESASG